MRRALPVLATLLALTALSTPSAEAYIAEVLFHFQDARISESSGLSSSSRRSQLFYTHNDSGDTARFFAVDRFGCTLATFNLVTAEGMGVPAIDWEDMASGPDETGVSSLYLGDIGDNVEDLVMRSQIDVYRVREPLVNESSIRTAGQCPAGVEKSAEPVERFSFRYVDGAHDAEALLIHPVTGQLFIVTKTFSGQSGVYAAPVPLRADTVNMLRPIAAVVFTFTGTPGGPASVGAFAQLAATAGDISPDGTRLVVRTYTDAYEWAIPPGDGDEVSDDEVALAMGPAAQPIRTALPSTVQGEAITYTPDSRSLLISSEGVHAPVHLLAG